MLHKSEVILQGTELFWTQKRCIGLMYASAWSCRHVVWVAVFRTMSVLSLISVSLLLDRDSKKYQHWHLHSTGQSPLLYGECQGLVSGC